MLKERDIEIYVIDYLNKNNIDYKGLCPDDIVINIACEVGEQILNHRHPNINHWIQHEYEDCLKLTEESQDLFDKYYDRARAYLTEINSN